MIVIVSGDNMNLTKEDIGEYYTLTEIGTGIITKQTVKLLNISFPTYPRTAKISLKNGWVIYVDTDKLSKTIRSEEKCNSIW